MKSILVIGMGRFGKHLALKLLELGNEVMIVDQDEEKIEPYASLFTDFHIGDCSNEAVLRSLGINNFDVCFVAISEDFQASLEITSMLREMGAKYIVSRANRDRQARFLLKVGADEVVYPEREIAERLALRFDGKNIADCLDLTADYSIYELPVPRRWMGKSVGSLEVARRLNINIIAVKHEDTLKPQPGAGYVFEEGDRMVVIGRSSDVMGIVSRFERNS